MGKGGNGNLKPFGELAENQQREISRKGAYAAAAAKRKKKTMREALEMLMYNTKLNEQAKSMLRAEGVENVDDLNHQMVITRSLIAKAEAGDVQAYNAICAMIGEKPAEKVGILDGFKTVFTTPTALMLTIGFSGLIFVITGFMTWIPAFLQEEFGQNQAAAGFNSMFWTYLAAFVGVLLAGSLSDKFAAKTNKARMLLQAFGLIAGAVFLFIMGGSKTLWVLYLSFAGWGFFRAFFDANTYTILYDVTPARLHASCSSAMITTGFAVGALAPVILGAMKQSLGSLSATFPVLGIIWVVCGVLMIIVSQTSYQKDYDKINKA